MHILPGQVEEQGLGIGVGGVVGFERLYSMGSVQIGTVAGVIIWTIAAPSILCEVILCAT